MSDLQSILPGGFDAAAVEPQENRSYEPMRAGTYEVEITNTDVKETKSGEGTGLKIEYTVVDGQYARRKVFEYLNLRHLSAQAEQIGQSQLSALCRAVGIGRLTDSDQLIGTMLRVNVRIQPAKDGYDASNKVTGYEAISAAPLQAAPAARQVPAAARQAQPPAAAKAAPPWKRGVAA